MHLGYRFAITQRDLHGQKRLTLTLFKEITSGVRVFAVSLTSYP